MSAEDTTAAAACAVAALDISDGGAPAAAFDATTVKASMVEQLKRSGASVIEDGDSETSRTDASQQLKGGNSYYYWHGDAERRRITGEQPVPLPLPKKLASSEAIREKRVKAIDAFSFLDDGSTVKVYVDLAGPLESVSSSDVEAEFSDRWFIVTMNTPDCLYKFHVDRLQHEVDALRCKSSVTKSRKLLIKLHKRNHIEKWSKLRAVG